MQQSKILGIIVFINYHSQQFSLIKLKITCLTQLITILFVFIYNVGQNTHILNEKCHFRQIFITNTIVSASFCLKCRFELVLWVRRIDYRYYRCNKVKELCSFFIFKNVIFNSIDKSDMSANYLGFIDKLIKFSQFQEYTRCPKSVQIFNNYDIIIRYLEKIQNFVKMFVKYRVIFYNFNFALFQI